MKVRVWAISILSIFMHSDVIHAAIEGVRAAGDDDGVASAHLLREIMHVTMDLQVLLFLAPLPPSQC
jgi:hypothetical protein